MIVMKLGLQFPLDQQVAVVARPDGGKCLRPAPPLIIPAGGDGVAALCQRRRRASQRRDAHRDTFRAEQQAEGDGVALRGPLPGAPIAASVARVARARASPRGPAWLGSLPPDLRTLPRGPGPWALTTGIDVVS